MPNEPLTEDELDALERLEREATPGPWECAPAPIALRDEFEVRLSMGSAFSAYTSLRQADARFIVGARNALPRLLAELTQLRDDVSDYRTISDLALTKVEIVTKERDEARAEVERLRAENERLRATLDDTSRMLAELVERARRKETGR